MDFGNNRTNSEGLVMSSFSTSARSSRVNSLTRYDLPDLPPSIALSQFVEFLWIREGDNPPESQSRLLPIGSMELVINPHEIEYRCLNATVGSAAALTARCSVVLILKPSSSTMVTKFLSWECISNRAAVPLSSRRCRGTA